MSVRLPMAVVGDVHGDYDKLCRLLDRLVPMSRRIFFVGDYVNRGNDSKSVIDVLISLRNDDPERFVFLAGNHDIAMRDLLASARPLSKDNFVRFAWMGGIPTLRSYVAQPCGDVLEAFRESVPIQHVRFLEALSACWEDEGLLVSHAGYDPSAPTDRSLVAMALQTHPSIFSEERGPAKLVVCGHYAQRTKRVHVTQKLICLDTGAGSPGGALSAVLLPEIEILEERSS